VNEEKSYHGGKSVVVGYRSNYRMILQVSTDSKEIHKLLTVIRNSGVDINYNAAFKLSPELLKNAEAKLIKEAVTDAMNKANVIAGASGTSLDGILKIEYGAAGYRPGPVMYMEERSMANLKTGGEEAFTQPDAIELTDRVTLTWRLK
jgi:uncharacterized protein YggE